MSAFDFDLVVIGGGSGGVRAARVAARLGARVVLIESRQLGGTCVNAGCIPKKLLVHAAEFGHDFVDAAGYGFGARAPDFDWSQLVERKNAEIARLNRVYAGLLENAGVQVRRGRARMLDRNTAVVDGRRVTGRYILIASGSTPHLPSLPGRELAITSDQAFHLERLPERVLLVGGGYIGLEFAGIFEGLGRSVRLVHHGDQVLRGFDREVRDHLGAELRKQGIAIDYLTELRSIEKSAQGLRVELTDGSSHCSDLIMFATGRYPNTADLGLAQLGVALDERGAVEVDDYARSTVENILAVGDCTGKFGLTPVAIAQGQAVAQTLFDSHPVRVDLSQVPTAVFSQPAVAMVGLPEDVARSTYPNVEAYATRFTPLKHRLSGRDQQNLVKLVVDADTDRVLGCHMVGADAPEIIQGLAVALKAGATKAQFDAVIGLHPTSAEEFVTLRRTQA